MKSSSLIKFSKEFSNWDWLVWYQTGWHIGYHTMYYIRDCPRLTIRNKSIWKPILVLNVYKLVLRSERMERDCLWHNCKEGNNSRILFILRGSPWDGSKSHWRRCGHVHLTLRFNCSVFYLALNIHHVSKLWALFLSSKTRRWLEIRTIFASNQISLPISSQNQRETKQFKFWVELL